MIATHRSRAACAGLRAGAGRSRLGSRRARRADAAQRLVRPDARALSGLQRRVRQVLEGEDRQDGRRSSSRTAARAGRRARSSTASRPTSSRWRSPTTSTRSRRAGLINAGWQKRLPQNSAPYTSTIVFLVRKGNPKGIKDWNDLVKPGVAGHHAEPEDLRRRALELPRRLGLRAAAAGRQRRQGAGVRRRSSSRTCRCSTPARAARPRRSCSAASATCCWRGRTRPTSRSTRRKDKFEIVVPSVSILAEPPVAVVDKVVDKKGTRAVAEAYLQYLYTPEGPGDRREAPLPAARSRRSRRSTRPRSRR